MSVAHAGPIRPLNVDEVLRMVEEGILHEDEKIELIDGVLIEIAPQGTFHATVVARTNRLLVRHASAEMSVRPQLPLQVSPISLPEPDLALVHGDEDAWRDRHPQGIDALLVVEVAFSSQQIDKQKATLYSQGRVPCFWLIDLKTRTLKAHAQPDGRGGWGREQVLGVGEKVMVPGLDLEVDLDELLR